MPGGCPDSLDYKVVRFTRRSETTPGDRRDFLHVHAAGPSLVQRRADRGNPGRERQAPPGAGEIVPLSRTWPPSPRRPPGAGGDSGCRLLDGRWRSRLVFPAFEHGPILWPPTTFFLLAVRFRQKR